MIALDILAFVLGTVFGSFINCMAWRIVHKESVTEGRSHCAVCGHPLSALDLVPIFSWLLLRGRCRYCGEKISPRYVIVEVLTGCVFLLTFLRLGISWSTMRALVLVCVLLGLSLVDLDIQEIPDGFLLFGVLWWVVCIPFMPEGVNATTMSGIAAGVGVGGGVLLVTLLYEKIRKKETMGGGDIKLLFMVSLYLGPLLGILNLILSCIVGLIFVAAMRSQKIPFGPAISISTVLCLLYGSIFTDWYIGLLMGAVGA